MKVPAGHYYILNAPRQHGDLWLEVTEDQQVKVKDPAGKWWRGRVFATVEEFQQVFLKVMNNVVTSKN